MKNMFGVVPGTKYGWPKNVLHWKGIHRSILDICATVPVHFVIADGIVAGFELTGVTPGSYHLIAEQFGESGAPVAGARIPVEVAESPKAIRPGPRPRRPATTDTLK